MGVNIMLLEPLVSTIETIKERISVHGPTLRENETRTRMALIDPLLQALGWDTTDPTLVTPEYRVGVGWADYALGSVGNKPAAVIEAKRLGSIVENHLDQAVGYCIQQGIAYAGVTDGSHWQLYRTFEPMPLVDKLVLDVSIANTSAHEAALKMLLLWRPNLVSGQAVEANEPLHGVQDPVPPMPDPNPGNWISLAKVETGKGQKPPIAVRFSGGEMKPIKTWWQVLTEVAERLVRSGQLTADQCPIAGLGFINSSPFSPSGKSFFTPKQVSGGLYLNAHMNSIQIVASSRRLLTRFHINPETVELRFE